MKTFDLTNYEILIDKVENSIGNIVYIHGFTGNFNNKMFLRKHYSNYNFYSLNFPGHGKSIIDDDEIDFIKFIEIEKFFIQSLNLKKFILIGHSMGGAIALTIANHFKNKISHLIIEAPANPSIIYNDKIISKLLPKNVEETKFIYNKLFYNLKNSFSNKLNYLNFIKKEFKELKNKSFLIKMLSQENIEKWMNLTKDSIDKNKLKTLVILGKYDKIIPLKETIEVFSQFKNYQIEIISNTSHLPVYEQRDLCFKLIDEFITIRK